MQSNSTKRVRFEPQSSKSTKARAPKAVADQTNKTQAAPSDFDFVRFQRHVETKAPHYTGKNWRVDSGTGEFTRKKFKFEGFRLRPNASRPWVTAAKAQAGVMSAEFDGPKFKAACRSLEHGKVADTKEWQAHLTVLATTQRKFEALQAWRQEAQKVKEARQTYQGEKQRLHQEAVGIRDEAQARLYRMGDERLKARVQRAQAKQLALPQRQSHAEAADTAARLQDAVMKPQPPSSATEVSTQEGQADSGASKKRGLLKGLKRGAHRDLSKLTKKKGKTADAGQAPSASASANRAAKKPVLKLDPAALSEWVFTQAARLDMNANELIEQWLLDDPLGAYLSDEQFDALKNLYSQLGNQYVKHFMAESAKQLAPLRDDLNQRIAAHNAAVHAYAKHPDPG